jgi:hypothetical protein
LLRLLLLCLPIVMFQGVADEIQCVPYRVPHHHTRSPSMGAAYGEQVHGSVMQVTTHTGHAMAVLRYSIQV